MHAHNNKRPCRLYTQPIATTSTTGPSSAALRRNSLWREGGLVLDPSLTKKEDLSRKSRHKSAYQRSLISDFSAKGIRS